MKKRVLLIPASLVLLSSCAERTGDIQNKYSSLDECKVDNNPVEIQQQMCKGKDISCIQKNPIADIEKKYGCEIKVVEGKPVFLGPAYPSEYYSKSPSGSSHSGGSGFFTGFWIGRALSSGSNIHSVYVPSSSKSYTGSAFKSSFSGSSGKSSFISRGGFGRSGFHGGSFGG